MKIIKKILRKKYLIRHDAVIISQDTQLSDFIDKMNNNNNNKTKKNKNKDNKNN